MRDSFVFYGSWLKIIESNYADDINKQRELIHSIILYGIKDEVHDDVERMFLQQSFAQIDAAQKKHQKRVDAGRKGGASGSGKAKARYGNKNASKTQANDNVNDNVNLHIADVGTRLNAVPPPQGWEWTSKVVESCSEHYRKAINTETGESKVFRLD